ncbi:BadF/BadG/BcrA/BcrD ATPase family protein [Pannonibacter tanglangensis]|uniref:ATPase n=1 Tax=Pannonibacter tanglangensis TaxID=2750084 RepID=A0ABW9ZHS3_9HYPH|nr:BadF/BadG/BcrA/BcrD ATPase family protein [Pannonibacter sp. XCT-34]NBN63961.1 ATPase [Pannonibacter sp. XCT-34]
MTLFLGIDGGGTGCRAIVADATGAVLGTGSAGPSNIVSDPDGALASILAAAGAALGSHGRLDDLHAVLGLAGGNVAEAVETLVSRLPFASALVVNDGVTAVKGALGDDDGVMAAIGTGTIFAVQRAGQIREIGGWGFILGDEASGAWMGRRLLAMGLRAIDGFVPGTPFLDEIFAELGGAAQIVGAAPGMRPADFARLAPRILAAAEAGDPAARRVVDDSVAEVAAAIELLQGGETLPVVFLGGLGPLHAVRLKHRWPQRAALGGSVEGAVFMARRRHEAGLGR